MDPLAQLYRPSLALLTDLYQLTMAQGYWKSGRADREAGFHLFFRRNPFAGGYAIACGLANAVDLLTNLAFDESDLAYLRQLTGNDQRPVVEPDFLDYLASLTFRWDIDAVPEGTVVFAREPLLRVQAPIVQGQILESALLNVINFQTLIATKAARICHATGDKSVLEFGLRRAQGIDGALSASRAAYVGGCSATSNVLAGKLFGIPVRGTHAHSWIMTFDTELEAFDAYAAAMPNNCVFLVDTYDTLDGVRRAIQVGRRLRERGHEMVGIRLDSGDLAYLSIEARRLLDDAGFGGAVIVASNDLDEHIIESLKQQGAAIGVWGVGTRLATGFDEPALGGVYKLTAIRAPGEDWQYKVKLSEQAVKVSTPGLLQVRRYEEHGQYVADAICDVNAPPTGGCTIVDPADMTRRKHVGPDTPYTDLLEPVFRDGRPVLDPATLDDARGRAREQLGRFHAGIRRLVHPHQYPVGLEQSLHDVKTRLILDARSAGPTQT
ncbi:MAG: nicotinate phosphoribosyltransferase [bacterium]|nr:nicotinate phosphoribosyltransferase [bacterium]